MEFRRRSLWNRVWEGEGLDKLGQEAYVRRIYEEQEGYLEVWKEMGYGIVLSAWKGVRWLCDHLTIGYLKQKMNQSERQNEPYESREPAEPAEPTEEPEEKV